MASGFSIKFCHLFMLPGNLPSTSVNVLCSCSTFCQLSVWLQDFLSTFCTAAGTSLNFPCCHLTFHQLSLLPQDLLSPTVKLPCSRWIYRQLPSSFHATESLLSTFINFPSHCSTFRQLLSSFRVAARLSVNILCGSETFCQLSVRL